MSKRDNLDDIITGKGIPSIDTDDEPDNTPIEYVAANDDIIIPGTVVVVRRDKENKLPEQKVNLRIKELGSRKQKYHRRSEAAKWGTKVVVRCMRKKKVSKGRKKDGSMN